MKKKLVSLAMIAALTFSSAIVNAQVPPHSVIIGDKAYSIDYIVKPANFAEIDEQLNKSNSIYYVSSTRMIDLFTGKPLSNSYVSTLPQITYKDGDGEIYSVLAGNGRLIQEQNPFTASADVSLGNGVTMFKNITLTTTVPDVVYYTVEGSSSVQRVGRTLKYTTNESYVDIKLLASDQKTLIAEGKLDVSSSGRRAISNLNVALGNTSANITNLGLVVQDSHWIYYRNPNDRGKLYKVKTDGVGKEEVSSEENVQYINIVGEDLYYVSVADREDEPTVMYKMDKRGLGTKSAIYQTSSDSDPINFGDIKDVLVAGNYIYYINNETGYLYRFKTKYSGGRYIVDGDLERVINQIIEDVNIDKNFIYYVNVSDYNRIYRYNTANGENTRLSNFEAKHLNVSGDWLYYRNFSDNEKLYRMKIDGTQNTKLSDDMAFNINVAGDWIFYKNYNDNNYLYKVKIDGSGANEEYIGGQIISKTGLKVSPDRVDNINIIDGWVYFTREGRGISMNKIRIDGKDRGQVD